MNHLSSKTAVLAASAAAAAVTESGSPAAQAAGVKYSGMDRGKAIFDLGSGSYQFASKLP